MNTKPRRKGVELNLRFINNIQVHNVDNLPEAVGVCVMISSSVSSPFVHQLPSVVVCCVLLKFSARFRFKTIF